MTSAILEQSRRLRGAWCSLPWMGLALGLFGSSCAARDESVDPGASPAPIVTPELSEESLRGKWQQLANPSLSFPGTVLSTPLGWFSLSFRSLGPDSKVPGPYQSYLYRSVDGVNWTLIPLPQSGTGSPNAGLFADMTFAHGTLVLVGSLGADVVLLSRNDHEFERVSINGQSIGFRNVTYAGDRFHALEVKDVYSSIDGSKWQRLDLGDAFLPNAVAYGNSLFVIAGNGGIAISSDGKSWQRLEIDCGLKGACETNPGGQSHNIFKTAWFSDGLFYANSLRSVDAITWEDASDGLIPFARWGDYQAGSDHDGVAVWKPGVEPIHLELQSFPITLDAPGNPGFLGQSTSAPSAPPPPDSASFPLDTGNDCTNSPCIVLHGRLYLAQ